MAATKYLDYNGLLYFWTLIKGMFAKPSDANPQMDGTVSAGSSALYARGDHRHPSDTSKASKSSTTSAGSYGPSADASPAHGGTFKVPYVTVNAEGIVTGVADKTITLPASGNTDQKVKQNLTGTTDTTKYPLLLKYTGTTTDSPTQESRYIAAVTLQPSTGTIEATKFKGTVEGSASSVANSLILKVKTGTTEGTDLYTYNGSAGKTLDIKQGTNTTLTAASGQLTIASADQKVKQNLTGTTDTKKYPLLLKYTDTATDSPTSESRYAAAVTLQPSTGTIEATQFKGAVTGNADTASALATARSINVQDADGTNTGTAASFDGTADATIKLPSTIKASLTGNASSASKVNNSLVLKVKTGTTEGTDLYTFNGSAGKTLDIKQGSNITLTAAAGSLTIAGVGDTKNTAGSTNSTSKLFIIGATSQAANPQTYSRASAYVGTDGHLYSNSKKVFTSDDAYTKSEIDTKLTGGMHYKGSVQTVADLPASGNQTGDFYNVLLTGENYAWDGSAWDQTGSMVDLQPITNAEIDTIVAS